jgi:hypothetical protein
MIRPINQMLKNEKPPEPVALKRLKSQLPYDILAKYFPKFAQTPNNLTFFDYTFDNVGNCNSGQPPNCRPMPIAIGFKDNANNRRQYEAFQKAANYDSTPLLDRYQDFYYQMMNDLNKYYCSIYA